MKKNNELVVACSNPFFKSRKTYNEIQRKLLYIAISQINPALGNNTEYADKNFMQITLPKRDVIKLLSNSSVYYTELREICEKMITKTVTVLDDPQNRRYKIITVFNAISFDENGFKFIFNDMMKPYILELKQQFSTVPLLDFLALSGNYSIAIYELIVANRWKHCFDISVDTLKQFLGVSEQKSYERFDNFRRKCVDVPLKEINDKMQYNVSYVIIKQPNDKRKAAGFRFYIGEAEDEVEIKPIQTQHRVGLYARELVNMTQTCAAKDRFTEAAAARICDKYPDEKGIVLAMEAVKEYVSKQKKEGKKVKVTAGLLTTALSEQWVPNSRYRQKKVEKMFPADSL